MKKRITIRIDEDVLNRFKSMDGNYQTLINAALRSYFACSDSAKPSQPKKYGSHKSKKVIKMVDDTDPYFRPLPKAGKKQ